MRIGLISDTHGLVRDEALAALHGVDRLLHAGDVGDATVLARLASIAPIVAVRGNNDHGAWADALPARITVALGGVSVHLLHDRAELAIDARSQRIAAVVAGHSHRPSIEARDGVLHVNPGSAGPRRFALPVTVAILEVADGRLSARIVELAVAPTAQRRR